MPKLTWHFAHGAGVPVTLTKAAQVLGVAVALAAEAGAPPLAHSPAATIILVVLAGAVASLRLVQASVAAVSPAALAGPAGVTLVAGAAAANEIAIA